MTRTLAALASLLIILVAANAASGQVTQPTETENVLWLHGNGAMTPRLWMNTLGEDPDDVGRIAFGRLGGNIQGGTTANTFTVPMHPEPLAAPLLFDTDGEVVVVVYLRNIYLTASGSPPFPGSTPLLEVTMQATLQHGETVIGSGSDSGLLTAPDPLNTPSDMDEIVLEVRFAPGVDAVQPEADTNLELVLAFTYSQAGVAPDGVNTALTLRTGGPEGQTPSRVELPLLAGSGVLDTAPTLDLPSTVSTPEAAIGGATSFRVALANTGETDATFTATLADLPEGWTGSVDPASGVSRANSTMNLTLRLDVPSSATPGDHAFVLNVTTGTGHSVVRTITITAVASPGPDAGGSPGTPASTDNGTDTPNDNGTALDEADAQAPGIGAAWLAAATLAAALVLRRENGRRKG